MKNTYKVITRKGKPAILTDRGLICLMEAGNQSTREKDAAEIVAILNSAPDLLAALRVFISAREGYGTEVYTMDEAEAKARKALAKVEGAQ